jgi:L-rhamnose 1-dehydrogenase
MGMLDGKVAAITGAVTGIGIAIAIRYLQEGACVAVNHFGDENSMSQFKSLVAEAPSGAKVIEVPGDISKYETAALLVNETVKAFGKLDVFVSNAGVCQFSDFLR